MSPNHDLKISPAQVAAALAVGTIAVLMVGVQPILLGELVEARQVSLEGVGIVAMAEIIMLGLGVLLGDALLPGARLRLITIVAALCAAGLDLLTLQATGDGAMTGVRAAAGLAEGVLVWGTTGVVVRTANPARVGGVFFVAQTLAQALLGAVLANAIIPRWGWPGGFVALGLLALVPCLLAFVQPARLSPLAPPAVSGFRWSATTLLPLAVVFLQLATLGSFWAYLEPLGKAAGFDARSAQTLIAAVLVMQVVGGSVAALAVRRLPVVPTLVACSLLLAAVTTTIHQLPGGSTRDFALACALFGSCGCSCCRSTSAWRSVPTPAAAWPGWCRRRSCWAAPSGRSWPRSSSRATTPTRCPCSAPALRWRPPRCCCSRAAAWVR